MKDKLYLNNENIADSDDFFLDQLKKRLSKAAGYSICSKADCAKLSETILNGGFGNISQSTLYRLFFQQGKHKPYKHTKDLLCSFLGYRNSEDFNIEIQNLGRNSCENEKGIDVGNCKNSLLFNCIETSSYKPLNKYFDRIIDESVHLKEYIGVQIYDCLKQVSNPDCFLKYYANHKYVREYFFEKGHDPNFRIKNYRSGYYHYLKNTEKYKQDYIFGNCVLFRHYFLAGLYKDAMPIGNDLYKDNPPISELKTQLEIFPFCRFLAYKIWHLQMNNTSQNVIQGYADFLLKYCIPLKINLDEREKKILFHTIAEAFIHSNLPMIFHDKLQEIFANEIFPISEMPNGKSLKFCIKQIEPNGLLMHRP